MFHGRKLIIEQTLGQGGEAIVHQCHFEGEQTRYALKSYKPIDINSEKDKFHLQRILYENQISEYIKKYITSDHILKTHVADSRQDEQFIYIQKLCELAHNGALFECMNIGPIRNQNIIKMYCRQLLKVISQLHQHKIVHQDIKLQNLLLDQQYNLKLCDFGVAIQVQDENQLFNSLVGTIDHLPPEVLDRIPYNPFKSDIFQLGITMFCIITGLHPFASEPSNTSNLYKQFCENEQQFWVDTENSYQKEFRHKLEVTDELKQIMRMMLNPNPVYRPDAESLLKMRYFQDFTWPKQQQLESYMRKKYQFDTARAAPQLSRATQQQTRAIGLQTQVTTINQIIIQALKPNQILIDIQIDRERTLKIFQGILSGGSGQCICKVDKNTKQLIVQDLQGDAVLIIQDEIMPKTNQLQLLFLKKQGNTTSHRKLIKDIYFSLFEDKLFQFDENEEKLENQFENQIEQTALEQQELKQVENTNSIKEQNKDQDIQQLIKQVENINLEK
ncbi:hypothetical protein pb186bvf_015399 [Paramecium bursaria]